MSRVLVAVASKHGATYDIASRIAERLRDHDAHVVVTPPDRVTDLDHYDAAIIGSAVYSGRWMSTAKKFVEESTETLTTMPIWFFSSGPLGSEEEPHDDLEAVEDLVARLGVRDHHMFMGKLDHDSLSISERIKVKAAGAPYGDFRNWADVDVWAEAIASELRRLVPAG